MSRIASGIASFDHRIEALSIRPRPASDGAASDPTTTWPSTVLRQQEPATREVPAETAEA